MYNKFYELYLFRQHWNTPGKSHMEQESSLKSGFTITPFIIHFLCITCRVVTRWFFSLLCDSRMWFEKWSRHIGRYRILLQTMDGFTLNHYWRYTFMRWDWEHAVVGEREFNYMDRMDSRRGWCLFCVSNDCIYQRLISRAMRRTRFSFSIS